MSTLPKILVMFGRGDKRKHSFVFVFFSINTSSLSEFLSILDKGTLHSPKQQDTLCPLVCKNTRETVNVATTDGLIPDVIVTLTRATKPKDGHRRHHAMGFRLELRQTASSFSDCSCRLCHILGESLQVPLNAL